MEINGWSAIIPIVALLRGVTEGLKTFFGFSADTAKRLVFFMAWVLVYYYGFDGLAMFGLHLNTALPFWHAVGVGWNTLLLATMVWVGHDGFDKVAGK